MTTSLTASIKPQFRRIGGLKIRCADGGGSHRRTFLLTSPWPESLYAFAPIWSTCRGLADLSAGLTSCLREPWAGSWSR